MKCRIKIKLLNYLFILFLIIFSCKKDYQENDPEKPVIQYGSISDVEGNTYKTVKIGTQIWMAENLKTTKYNDGTKITYTENSHDWQKSSIGRYCWYKNDINYGKQYGGLYNWYAVNTGKLCPKGWHIPSENEWELLINYLGGEYIAGGKMKSLTEDWESFDHTGNNSSGFSGLPGGSRNDEGTFVNLGGYASFYSSTESSSTYAYSWYLFVGHTFINESISDKHSGKGCRCIQD